VEPRFDAEKWLAGLGFVAAVAVVFGLIAWNDAEIAASRESAARLGHNSDAALATGPVAYLRLGEIAGKLAVNVGKQSRVKAAYIDGVARTTTGVSLDGDPAIQLDGVSSGVKLRGVRLGRSFTVLVWVRSAAPTWNQNGWIISARNPSGFIVHPIKGKTDVAIYMTSGQGGSKTRKIATVKPTDITQWHQYGVMYDEAEKTAYAILDGRIVDEMSYLPSLRQKTSVLSIALGYDDCCGGGRHGRGAIDEFTLFDRVLSQDELAGLMGKSP
jgi:hypothetical protein